MKEYITGDYVANAVRMKRSLHTGAFLIVEGGDDKTLFNNFIDHEECQIEIGFGKHNVVSAITTLNTSQFPGVLAIADADFRNIQPDGINEPNLLFTDDHDLECMILRSTALDRLLTEFGIQDRVEAFARQHGSLVGYAVARSASAVGHLLLVSLNNNHGLVFDGLPFSRFVSPESLQTDISAMLTEVKNKSQKHSLDWPVIEQDVIALRKSGHDPWQVCCGHHVIDILAIAFRYTFASHRRADVAPIILAKCLRLAYRMVDFMLTALYSAMREWEANNAPYRILHAVP